MIIQLLKVINFGDNKNFKKHGFEIRFKNKMILRNIFEYVIVNKNLVK